MARRATNISLDAALKQILRDQDLATGKDVKRLVAKIDQLEKMVRKLSSLAARRGSPAGARAKGGGAVGLRANSATSTVLEHVKRSRGGVDFADLQEKTGFEEKKLRNIIFRLHKLGYIQRVGRGKYSAK